MVMGTWWLLIHDDTKLKPLGFGHRSVSVRPESPKMDPCGHNLWSTTTTCRCAFQTRMTNIRAIQRMIRPQILKRSGIRPLAGLGELQPAAERRAWWQARRLFKGWWSKSAKWGSSSFDFWAEAVAKLRFHSSWQKSRDFDKVFWIKIWSAPFFGRGGFCIVLWCMSHVLDFWGTGESFAFRWFQKLLPPKLTCLLKHIGWKTIPCFWPHFWSRTWVLLERCALLWWYDPYTVQLRSIGNEKQRVGRWKVYAHVSTMSSKTMKYKGFGHLKKQVIYDKHLLTCRFWGPMVSVIM